MVVFHHSHVRHTITYTIKSPGFEQYVQDTTRKNNILDKCYVNIKNAYVARVGPPISTSDHNVVCITPVYKSKLKRGKPVKKVVRT